MKKPKKYLYQYQMEAHQAGRDFERERILKLIDEEAKRQYEEFKKETHLELQPNGWEDWKIDRNKLKSVILGSDEK